MHALDHSLVLLSVVSQDQIFELHLHLDPFLISEGWPDVVGLCDGCLVWFQDHLGPVVVDMERPQDQDETREGLQTHKTNALVTQRGSICYLIFTLWLRVVNWATSF